MTCFNAIYNNTQITLIINSFISFGFSLIYPFIICIIPTIFRFDSLKIKKYKKNNINKNKKDKESNKLKNIKKNKNNKNKLQKNEFNKNINIQSYKEAEYTYKISQWLQIL